ncbi:DUF4124 domain-containing protein [Luteimonas sp. RIT-PG2_3]
MRVAPALLLLLAALLPHAAELRAADGVTVYRCTDAKGHVSLSDRPCPAGSDSQVRNLPRPVVTAAPPPPPPETPTPAVAEPPPRVIVVRTRQPMYECVRPDDTRYTSDSNDGNPRWVPLWTLEYPRPSTRIGGILSPDTSAHPPSRPPPGHADGRRWFDAGTWIRDECHALPQAEVCARLGDRRDEIRRRFFNAQESERNTLRSEERGINARLSADCGVD